MRNAKGLINYLNYPAKGDNNYPGNSPRGGNSPELCEGWWPASGGSAPSEKTCPGILEHVSYGFDRLFMFFITFDDFRMSGLVFLVSGLEPAQCERCK